MRRNLSLHEGPGTERHIHHGIHDSKKHPEINTDHSIVENLRQLAGADIGLGPHLASLWSQSCPQLWIRSGGHSSPCQEDQQ